LSPSEKTCLACQLHNRIDSVLDSAWFRYFTRPGMTRELKHELSASNRFSQFRHYFCMPLQKVKELCDLLLIRGYIPFPRMIFHQKEFCEHTELLVMSSLYILGPGASFWACQPLCYISTSEVLNFVLFLKPLSTCMMIRSTCHGTIPS
jgi:hypothetical protein